MRSITTFGAIGLLLCFGTPAEADSSFTIQIVAQVQPFCRVNVPDEQPINLVNGSAEIGVIHEICNTEGGYDVLAQFTNVSGGEVNVAGRNYAIGTDGTSVRRSNNPESQDLNWEIADATLVQPSVPVLMHVTITPR